MRRLMLIVVALLTAFVSYAQYGFEKHSLGFLSGVRANDMLLSDPSYRYYAHLPHVDYSFGITSRHRVVKELFIRTDLLYVGRGSHLKWCDIDYEMALNYVDLRLPLQYNFDVPFRDLSPYVGLGPMVNIACRGIVDYQSDPTGMLTMEMTKSSIRQFDIGMLAVCGIDFPFDIARRTFFLTVEASYGLGLCNTFSRSELSGAVNNLNSDMENMSARGMRRNHGLELSVGLSIPFAPPKPKIERSFVPIYEDEVGEPVIEKDPVRIPVAVEYRDCYTIDDIIEYLDAGVDIVGMRICLFDINFAFDSYDLNFGVRQNLKKFARVMQEYPEMRICINGHTDSLGSHEYNDALSLYRAKSVGGYLCEWGICSDRMDYKGYGKRMPIESNSTEWGRHRNRRVEIDILHVGNKRNSNNEKQSDNDNE